MKYRLVEITPEEYVALGTAGVWVFASDGHTPKQGDTVLKHFPDGDGCDPDRLTKFARPNVFPGQPHYFRHYYTRIEQDVDQDV